MYSQEHFMDRIELGRREKFVAGRGLHEVDPFVWTPPAKAAATPSQTTWVVASEAESPAQSEVSNSVYWIGL